MKLTKEDHSVIEAIYRVELNAIASSLGLIEPKGTKLDYDLLLKALGLIDRASREEHHLARKIVIGLSSLLWTYRDKDWIGLSEYLIVALNRAGYPPSSIMLDDSYDHVNGSYTHFQSLANELEVTVRHMQYEVQVGGKPSLLTHYQKAVWESMKTSKCVGISAPTSAGKSYVILLKIIDLLLAKRGSVIYIVPTLSLVAQVSSDMRKLLRAYGIDDVRVTTTYNVAGVDEHRVYVITQEKGIAAFSQDDAPYKNIRALVVDEIQNIERADDGNDQRGKILYDLLVELRHSASPALTVLSGPRVEGLEEIGADIFNVPTVEQKTNDSPVTNITYSIIQKTKGYVLKLYSDLLERPLELAVANGELIQGYGAAKYSDEFHDYLSTLIDRLGKDAMNVIFSPTSKQARRTALGISSRLSNFDLSAELATLIDYIKETVHEDYDLCIAVAQGTAYHHGKSPGHIRFVIEDSIKRKLLRNVVCTTTLIQGVNLPAQNVIMRTPNLRTRRENGRMPKLTDYEIANLRGRAGRLLKDIIGRTFVLEENSFETDQPELFSEVEKRLTSGYGDRYGEKKKVIDDAIEKNKRVSDLDDSSSFLTTYIRQAILRHGGNASARLASVGINLSDDQISRVESHMQQLAVDPAVCLRNRYWDPLDLNDLLEKSKGFVLPTGQFDYDLSPKLEVLLRFFNETYPKYYNKYCYTIPPPLIQSVAISTANWMQEKPLKEILSNPFYSNSDRIDEGISRLQNSISYGVPMLLKPLYDILEGESMILRFIEMGAYLPVTRKLIEMSIPRETAIYLQRQYFSDTADADLDEEALIERLAAVRPELDYWRGIQVDQVL
jgi:hypothetical protein